MMTTTMTTMITEEVDQQMQQEVPAIGSTAIWWSAKALSVSYTNYLILQKQA